MTPPTEEHARQSILSRLNPALLSPTIPGWVCTLVLSSGQTAGFAPQLCEPTPCARCHDVSRPVSSSPRGPDPTCTMAVLSVVRQCHELSIFLGPRDTGCPGAARDGSCSSLLGHPVISLGLAPVGHVSSLDNSVCSSPGCPPTLVRATGWAQIPNMTGTQT